eukprot:799111-Pleurochrysis_carterae.AAC.1
MHAARNAAIDFSRGLNEVSSYKHQSWYVHFIVFIVPQQLFEHGDTWAFSTCGIEARGARLKHMGRRVTNWRKLAQSPTVYEYVDRQTGKAVSRQQSYSSSPTEQMMLRICAQEASWHD